MLNHFFTRIFGSRNQREIRRFEKIVTKINALEGAISALSDADLQAKIFRHAWA